MNQKRKRKLIAIIIITLGVSTAIALMLVALKKNIDLYYTPQQALAAHFPMNKKIRLGGLVKKNSIVEDKQDLGIRFVITDLHQTVSVLYQGVLPSLFREGKGVIAAGYFNQQGVFIASEVLAKHDENYKPPGV